MSGRAEGEPDAPAAYVRGDWPSVLHVFSVITGRVCSEYWRPRITVDGTRYVSRCHVVRFVTGSPAFRCMSHGETCGAIDAVRAILQSETSSRASAEE